MFSDVRYTLRVLRQNRAFAAVAILSLALGIGANTAIFTLIDNVMLRPLPVRALRNNWRCWRRIRTSHRRASTIRTTVMSAITASRTPVCSPPAKASTTAFSVPGEKGASAEVIATGRVSGNYFDVLGRRRRDRPPAHARRTTSPRARIRTRCSPGICGSGASAASAACWDARSRSTACRSRSSAWRRAAFTELPSAPSTTSTCRS